MRKFQISDLALVGILSASMFYQNLEARDDQGENAQKAQRIVSLCLPVTETICQLGMEDRIVGISEGDCPKKVKNKPKVGKAFGTLNIESVIALKPDLVFCWGDGAILKEKGLNVYPVSTRDLGGVIKLVEEVAELLGEKKNAEPIVASMRVRMEMIISGTKGLKDKPLVYFEAGSMGKTR